MSSDATIDFAKMDGLVPAIVQDAASGEVLMVGFFNEKSYRRHWRAALSPSGAARGRSCG